MSRRLSLRAVAKVAAVLLAGAVVFGVAPSPAEAHTSLQSSDPAPGAVLTQAPVEIRLTFVDEVQPQFATVTVEVGEDVARELQVRVEGQSVIAALGSASDQTQAGASTDAWLVNYSLVTSDAHTITGSVTFAVENSVASASPPAAPWNEAQAGEIIPPTGMDSGVDDQGPDGQATVDPRALQLGMPEGGAESDRDARFPWSSVVLLGGLTALGILIVGALAGFGARRSVAAEAAPALRRSTVPRAVVAAGLLALTAAAAGAFALVGGADAVAPSLTVARGLHDGSAALTVGLLIVTVGVLPPDSSSSGEWLGALRRRALRAAAASGGVWVASGTAVTGITYLNIGGSEGGGPAGRFLGFLIDPALGGRLVLAVALAAVASSMAVQARRTNTAAVATLVAAAALVSAAARGHGAEPPGLAIAVQALHVIGVSAWIGGLSGLLLLRRALADRFLVVARRYSSLAGWSFAAVLASGIAGTFLRLDDWAALTTTYGQLLLAKSAALLLLGVAGWWQRSRLLARHERNGHEATFVRLAVGELLVMVVAIGLAVNLSSSSPPPRMSPGSISPVQLLPVPGPIAWLTQWSWSLGWLVLAAVAVVGYLGFAVAARRPGRPWQWGRVISWVAGWLVVVVVTNGAPAVYAQVTLVMQVLVYITLAAVAPVFFVLARPLAHAEAVLPARTDGSRGLLEWLWQLRAARLTHLLGRPEWALLFYAAVLGVVMFGPAVAPGFAVVNPLAALSVLLAGCVLARAVRRALLDPTATARRQLGVVFSATSIHGLLGLVIMAGVGLDLWSPSVQVAWAPDPLDDRWQAGELIWTVGAGAVVSLALVVLGVARLAAARAESSGRAIPADPDAVSPAPEPLPARLPLLTRREMLLAAGGTGVLVSAGVFLGPRPAGAADERILSGFSIVERVEEGRRRRGTGRIVARQLTPRPIELDIGGRIVNTWGYGDSADPLRCTAGDQLSIDVLNGLPEPTTVHWHGLQLRNDMDGVPYLTQDPIAPGDSRKYLFTAPDPGTYWFHPHVGTQRDRGLFAPLIVEDPREGDYDVEFVIVVDDWIDGVGATPDALLRALAAGPMGSTYSTLPLDGVIRPDWKSWQYDVPPSLANPPPGMAPDPVPVRLAGEVRYPFHLLNGRLPSAPQTFTGRPGQRARLRLINAAGTTTYRLALGGHRLTVTHSDGFPVDPVTVDTVQIAPGERYDVSVELGDGAFPLVAVAEGQDTQAFAVIRTASGPTPPADAQPAELSGRLLRLSDLSAASQVRLDPKDPDVRHPLYLTGDMYSLSWHINAESYDHKRPYRGITPLPVREGERVRLSWINQTPMYHPMHVHGHTFQVRAIGTIGGDRRRLRNGPRKDTVLVPPGQIIDIDLVADNPGQWLAHCHNSVHMEMGMATIMSYRA